jgi:branched-chain amino acid aminotransferase
MKMIYVNGKITEAQHAVISVFDRGLVLGDGLFETVRSRRGVPEFFSEHYERLLKGARDLMIEVPLSETEMRRVILELCQQSEIEDAVTRIILTRGQYEGTLSINPQIAPTLIITVGPVPVQNRVLALEGVDIALTSISKGGSQLGTLKTTNYLPNIMAKAQSDAQNCHDAMLLGEKGNLAEITTASFFCYLEGKILTPYINNEILPGITRKKTIEAMEVLGIRFGEAELFPDSIPKMEWAFMTSSVRGLIPIRSLNGVCFPIRQPEFLQIEQKYGELSKRSLILPE